ncbi:DEAD/DEAH box helicase [Microbacterium sp. YMB-B2]|uniref:DEAD/DEAH box helicase n=1 Tax=Microbacterium tenebrionis TaxID=2830665 RepID=A0A9X1RYM7_9MICO|nr:DEAD/DEAH box helicase [Microbacterium tenebrionis]MCC2028706.1 DEAD/DEAH box helicase [Microbacterium tenebrionis]
MPKNGKPKGGRPSRNFEPRYAKKTSFHDRHAGGRPGAGRPDRDNRDERTDAGDRGFSSDRSRTSDRGFDRRPGSKSPSTGSGQAGQRPGSRSPSHRGYRPAEADGGAPKRRWTDQERAGRDEARGIRGRAASGRREAPHHRDERSQDSRGSYGERPRYGNDRATGDRRYEDRPRRDERGGERPRFQGDRPRFHSDRSESPRYNDDRSGDRRSFNNDRNDRGGDRRSFNNDRNDRGGDRRSSGRDDRPARDDRRSFNDRNERGGDRRSFNRDARPARDDRPARDGRPFTNDRNERPRHNEDRPRFDRDERPARDDRRPFTRDDRTRRDDRPRFDRDDRPRRDDRGATDRARRDDRAQLPSRDDWNKQAPARFEPTEDVVHERLEAQVVAAPEVEGTTFADLGLGSNIVETLKNMGATAPFPIQGATIPSILEGRDVLGRGRTGSGKTIAFGAPLVESILTSQAGKRREIGRAPRAIILAPTRELALQIDRTVQPIARSVGLFTTQIYGGVPQGRQVGALKKGVDIVIGTPGRVEDLINQGKLDLSDCRIAVLDEADHMCELGFVEPVQRILRHTQEGSQKLLFSATLDREVAALVDEFLVDPAVYEVAGEDQDSSTIDHRVLVIDHRDKAEILTSMVDRDGKTLVFARTRAYAEMLAEQFEDAGIPAVSLHGDLNQAKRTRNLQKMTSGRVNVLVATDVAARGIHVDDIDLVIQADAPDEYKTYMHRAGRTGRAGRSGRVVTLITRQRQRRMNELLERAEIDAPFEPARLGDDVIEELAGRMPSDADLTA